ncbi:MAG: ferredoxin [Enhygromyxa sp.]
MSLRIEIDALACEANGVCTQLLPEALELDDDDLLHRRLAVLPAALEQRAGEAVRRCPRQALRLVEDPGAGRG